MSYTPIAEREATTEFDARLTKPLLDGLEIVTGDLYSFPCATCGAAVKFATVRDTLSPLWGLAGLDGGVSNTYGNYCAKHA